MLKPIQPFRAVMIMFMLGITSSSTLAVNIAVIDTDCCDPSRAEFFCNIFENMGHACTAFPTSGPTSSLGEFDVVFDLSEEWSDPDKLLVDHLHKGKGVITLGGAPLALGIDTDPVVQAWIGANSFIVDGDLLITTDTDPMLGNTPLNTAVGFCGDSPCGGLSDTSGHTDAKVLVNFADIKFVPNNNIGMLRNRWEGGQSVYISDGVEDIDVILRAVEILGNPIPAVSTWGLIVMTVTFLIIGTILIRHRKLLNPSC